MNKEVTRRGFVGLAAATGAAVVLTGCSAGGSASSGSASAAASGSAAASKGGNTLRFVTGGESGTYYAFGSVIAQHATNNAGIKVTALTGNGSQSNVTELEDGNADLGFCQSDVMAYAYNGTNLFDGMSVTCFSTVASLYQEQVQIVTYNPDIKTVADLKGKKVSVGAAGSGVYFNALDVLKAYGLTEADIKATYQSFSDSAGAPTTAITDLSTSKQAYLVSMDAEHVKKLMDDVDYYGSATIKAGTYGGIDTDTTTVAVKAVVLANDTVAEDDIYALTADIFDNAADLVESHAKYAEINVEEGASITSVPYHPGAAKYFKEKGFDVATK